MKILVTGGAGFIGSHVCEFLLKEDHEVISVDNFNDYYEPALKYQNITDISKKFPNSFLSEKADIRDEESLRKIFKGTNPEAVIHLAAMAGVRPSIQNPGLYMDVNIKGTHVVLETCREHQVRSFIFASSSSVYGNNRKVPFSEIDNVDFPISPYAATKKAGELLCHTYSHLYDMRTVCLRFFTVYGPRQRPDLAIRKFTELMLRGEEIPYYGDGSTRRDYTFVGDIVDGVVKALYWNASKHSGNYHIFNLGESQTISLKEMVACIERVTGKRAQLKKLPPQAGDVEVTFADVTKAKKILNYNPCTTFESGMLQFVEWLRGKK